MNGIIGMTELALDTPLTAEQREYIGLVKASADALLNVINDILDFSKMESGKFTLESVPFCFRDILGGTLKALTLRARAQQKGLDLIYQIPPSVPDTLVGDLGRLRQVLVNLVGNAIKLTAQGTVTVSVATASQTTDNMALHIAVADTGVGIPATIAGPGKRPPLHILVAEDNAINQQLVVRLLAGQGHTVEIASTGAEALAALEQQRFDLVLMDVQMPEMDGFEATAAIRARERDTNRHTPIIAMTAHAMRGDQEKCLNAGMDAYLSKPMLASALYASIDQLLHDAPAEHRLAPESMPEAPVDLAAVLETVEGDKTLLTELLRVFARDYPERLADVREAIMMGDAKRLECGAHSLRGAVGLFGAKVACDLAMTLESMGSEARLDSAAQVLRELEQELERVIWFFDHSGWEIHA
jgi:CheY-like chemotaxis protein/HPt (histidine-containing phosphotransfer) domain-containing protein